MTASGCITVDDSPSSSICSLFVQFSMFCCYAEPRNNTADTSTWVEQLCRRWAVRYRSRQHPATNGPQVRRQLVTQFNICRSRDACTVDRLAAMLLCWYLARVDHVHGLMLTAISSHLRLAVAVILVSVAMLLLAGCVVATLRLVWSALTMLVYSLLHFTLLLATMLAGTLATLTLVASFHS